MENNLRYMEAKRQCNLMGWSLVIFYMILNQAVTLVYMFDAIIYGVITGIQSVSQGTELDMESFVATITERMMTNFWGYMFAIAFGMLILFLWKGKDFWCQEICAKAKPMTTGTFFCLLAFLVAAQAVTQVLAPVQEWFYNQFGLSAMAALEYATITGSSLSMFLYIGFIGPFAEEILFRGLVLRSLRPYGKQFAVFVSAMLFGLYHGNVIQIPYAFLVGLLLAYVTVEHSIFWAVVLHVFNNFVLADLFSRLAELLPAGVGDMIFTVLIFAAAFAAIVIGIIRRKEIAAYFKENTFDNDAMRGFICAPAIWVFTAIMLCMAGFMLTL